LEPIAKRTGRTLPSAAYTASRMTKHFWPSPCQHRQGVLRHKATKRHVLRLDGAVHLSCKTQKEGFVQIEREVSYRPPLDRVGSKYMRGLRLGYCSPLESGREYLETSSCCEDRSSTRHTNVASVFPQCVCRLPAWASISRRFRRPGRCVGTSASRTSAQEAPAVWQGGG
jgi:hypothetical protein